jgi:hypothetical protein
MIKREKTPLPIRGTMKGIVKKRKEEDDKERKDKKRREKVTKETK